MQTAELLATLRERDVHLWVEEGRLRCNAPAGALSADLKAALAARKDDIVALLRHAEALRSGWSAIVPLKADGRRPPLFAIPGHNGDVFCYRALASRLDADQPLLGVQPPGLDGNDPIRSIDELARYEVRQIRQYRPHGPYLIAGYCAGGTVAFEVARQLTEQGQQVALLALFGSTFPTLYRWRSQVGFRTRDLAARGRRHVRAILSGSWAEGIAYLRSGIHRYQERRTGGAGDRRSPVLKYRRRVERATMNGIRGYELRPYPGRIDLFLSSEAERWTGGLPHQWSAVAGSLHKHIGPDGCDIDVMLKEPHVARLAEELSSLLRGVGCPAGRGDGSALGALPPALTSAQPGGARGVRRWPTLILGAMNRVHLFEFNDQRWLPRWVTGWLTQVLRIGHGMTDDGRVWAPKVLELVRRHGQAEIVDLCSGGGGPVLEVARILEEEHGVRPRLTLTDIIPNLQAAREINDAGGDRIYLTRSINATDVPGDIKGVRTVFSGFHHLKPELAFRLLKNAFDCRQHIFIGETTKRCPRALRIYGGGPPRQLLRLIGRARLTATQRFFTLVVPILPLMLGWDNVVSCLRTYSRREIEEFLARLQSDDYRWEVGELWNPGLRTPYPYLVGYPVSRPGEDRADGTVAASEHPAH